MAFVSFEDVHKIYHIGEVAIPAADGVTFSLERGELVVIIVFAGRLSTRSCAVWRLIQKSGVVLNAGASSQAVSGVTPRLMQSV